KAGETAPRFLAGHIAADGPLVDVYKFDTTGAHAKGRIDPATNSIVIDVPLADFKTTLEKPDTQKDAQVVAAMSNGDPLYGATGSGTAGKGTGNLPATGALRTGLWGAVALALAMVAAGLRRRARRAARP